MEIRDQAIHKNELEPWVDEEVCAALLGCLIGTACQRFEQAHHGRADGDHAAAGRLGRRDPLTCTGRQSEGLAVQALALHGAVCQPLEGTKADVQRDVEYLHAGCAQLPLNAGGEVESGGGCRC